MVFIFLAPFVGFLMWQSYKTLLKRSMKNTQY
nr:MAG TPA: hypothetical protein [Caudoviricetes sp.]DAS11403.1 MAG TPA: hypothetical protein [Caudoviricetes sp.]